MKTLTVSQMRALDARTIGEGGIPGAVLMENAGRGAGELILEFAANLAENHVKRFVLLAGKGNNGGDAYVVAKFLSERTVVPVVLRSVCPISDLKGDALFHAELTPSDVDFSMEAPSFKSGDIVIDALLGTGSTGAL
ncbi:MAG: bifunctional ADP-dependent NAD(P)H-hydrate dehydratase/NAD(P)H-hydrate epimerase, partial [Kiritimatiellaeota bacterium]|nr:bifunctional ADP-dependent NAD(P)H-hydrate dehydratase/NAD(P)H-hydrate epimerase [Kiritimatiellota bacterium]